MNRAHFDPTVSAGHVLTAVTMGGSAIAVIVAVTMAWSDLRSDLDDVTRRVTDTERRIEQVPSRLARIETILERIEAAQHQ